MALHASHNVRLLDAADRIACCLTCFDALHVEDEAYYSRFITTLVLQCLADSVGGANFEASGVLANVEGKCRRGKLAVCVARNSIADDLARSIKPVSVAIGCAALVGACAVCRSRIYGL